MNNNWTTNLTLSRVTGKNRAIVAMGYDNIENTIVLSIGEGDKLPDPLIVGSYDIVWWNLSDYVNPANDPQAEIVKCIAKYGDTLMIIRSQNGPAYGKNIFGKTYSMVPFPANNNENVSNNISSLSYYNVPQMHGSTLHDGTVETTTGASDKVTAHNVATGVHGVTGSVAGTAGIQTFSSKILDNTNTITIKDVNLTIQDDVTATKQAKFQASGISAVTTRTITLQDADITMESTIGSQTKVDTHNTATVVHGATGAVVGTTNTQTLSGKTLTTPTIADFTNANHTHAAAGATGGIVDHVNLASKGTNTHAQIDTAIGTTLPGLVTTHAGLATGVHGVTGSYILGTEDIGAVNGVAGLDANGKIPTSQLPGLALTNVYTVADQTAQLALNATTQQGDIAIRSDEYKSYVRNAGVAGTMADWSVLLTPTDVVTSVFGRTGVIAAAINDYTWAQINKATSNIADITTKSHTSLTDIGTNTHAQIDTQIATTLPGLVTTHNTATVVHGATGAVVGTTNTQTLSGKTLTAPIIADFTNANHTHAATGATGGIVDHVNLASKGTNTHAQIDTQIATTLPGLVTTHAGLATGVHGVGANTIEHTGNKNAANGYAGLSSSKHSITSFPIVSTGIAYSALTSDYTIVATAAVTITIPAAGTAGNGKIYNIKSNVAGTVTITSASNIDSTTTYYMYARYETICIQSDGTQWWVV